MRVAATYHQPSSVSHSIKCSLDPNSELEHLVIAKSNRIEVLAITPQGLKLLCTQEIWGRISSLHSITMVRKHLISLKDKRLELVSL